MGKLSREKIFLLHLNQKKTLIKSQTNFNLSLSVIINEGVSVDFVTTPTVLYLRANMESVGDSLSINRNNKVLLL